MGNDIGNINPAAKPVRSAEKTAETAPVVKTTAVQKPQNIQVPVKAEMTLDVGQQEKQVKEAISKLNEMAKASNQRLGFSMDPHINGPVITVHNTQTGELVRTIPSEEVLRVAKSIDSLKGVIFSEKM
jgi:flagellar protein FlaG